MFITSLAVFIKKQDRLPDDIKTIKNIIKKRVSYYGIYSIFQQLDEQQDYMISLEEKVVS